MTQEPFLYLEAGANDPTAIIGNDFNFQLSFTLTAVEAFALFFPGKSFTVCNTHCV